MTSARAMMAAVAKWLADMSGALTTGGTSTAYTLTTNSVFDTLAHMSGQMVTFIPNVTNGTPVTLAVDGLTAKPLRYAPSIELHAGTLVVGAPYAATYNNSDGAFYLQDSVRTGAPTYQAFTSGSAATYTTPSGATWLRVRMVGGGGGGGAASGGTAGGTGGTTIFNSINANGGAGGAATTTPQTGAAGGASGTGTATLRVSGSPGSATGAGGSAPFFGGGAGSVIGASQAGTAAVANSGGGGGGVVSASGGGSGEYVEIIIPNPAATYTYTVGAAGAASTGGTVQGAAGAAGRIVVEEHYN